MKTNENQNQGVNPNQDVNPTQNVNPNQHSAQSSTQNLIPNGNQSAAAYPNKLEQALICTLFLNETTLLDVSRILTAEMFDSPDMGFIYGCMLAIADRGEQPDLMLTENEMKRQDAERCRRMDGVNRLTEGIENHPLDYNAEAYAREVKRRWMMRSLAKQFQQQQMAALLGSADPLELMIQTDNFFRQLREETTETGHMQSLGDITLATIAKHRQRRDSDVDPFSLQTGFDSYDTITGGFFRGDLIVLGGLTSDGKTALAMHMAMNIARQDHTVLHFSYEMTEAQTADRFMAGNTGITSRNLRFGILTDNDFVQLDNWADEIKNLPYYFVNPRSHRIEDIRTSARMMQRRTGCDLILVDYLHILASVEKHETVEQAVSRCVKGLKDLAVELNCCVLLISQLNRKMEDRDGHVPAIADLRDSGAIEHTAENVMIIYNPSRWKITKDSKGNDISNLLMVHVLKSRNAQTGIAEIARNPSFTRFWSPEKTTDNKQS